MGEIHTILSMYDYAMVFGEERNRVSLGYSNGSELLHLGECVSDAVDQPESMMGEPEVVSINGNDGEFVSVFGINTLRWSADGIDYSLSGSLAEEEMVRVAESIT